MFIYNNIVILYIIKLNNKGENVINLNNKQIIVHKSPYSIANQYKLEATLRRVNDKYYDVDIVEKGHIYIINVKPKIEMV